MSPWDELSVEVPWPEAVELTRAEVAAYLADAGRPDWRHRPTSCAPWTVDDVTAHLVATFERFAAMRDRTRAGDDRPPFGPDELDAENLAAVAAFVGDPLERLPTAVAGFLDDLGERDEPIAHQFGPITAAVQVLFGLNDVAIHHHDIAAAAGGAYRPPDRVLEVLGILYERFGADLPGEVDPWAYVLSATGR